jgi:K(+)-stimulated pyrophosphate-energized sodium pump
MLFIYGMIPVVFSALAMNSGKPQWTWFMKFVAVQRNSRNYGRNRKPEYGKCVEISTKAALREMMLPEF